MFKSINTLNSSPNYIKINHVTIIYSINEKRKNHERKSLRCLKKIQ